MKYAKILLICILLSGVAAASSISQITVQIENSGMVNLNETISLAAGESGESLWIPKDIEKLAVYDSQGPVTYNISEEKDRKIIMLILPKTSERQKDVYVEYSTESAASKNKGIWKLELALSTTASKTIIKIVFPKNSTILNWTSSYRFSLGLDTLYIYPDVNETSFTATYQFVGGDSQVVGDESKSKTPYALYALLLASLIVIVHLTLRRRKTAGDEAKNKAEKTSLVQDASLTKEESLDKPENNPRELKDSVYKMLEDEETKVVDVLKNNLEEEITQAQIYHVTGIPKASLSDIMNRLERRNIIERTKDGRVKWVKLKKWVYK
jgi:uncharacterized membrane protein